MLFNSLVFLIFLPIVWILYMLLRRNYRAQNFMLLVASYVFYGWWDWRFLSLIIFTTVVNFFLALAIERTSDETPDGERKRRIFLVISLIVSLGLLGFFKYFNFFTTSFAALLRMFGLQAGQVTLQIVLPVGISFFTFKTLSYTIDVYRKDLPATTSIVDCAVFIAFFPQLVAGPIERASNLLPQFERPRRITSEGVSSGIFLFIWGMFKKVVIADNVAKVADAVFNNYRAYHGLDLWIGVLAFAVQIYCDFSAYSDIARGIGRFFGFELMVNFRLPYFALNPGDFWNRWHISLSSWFRDYVFLPLEFVRRRSGFLRQQTNIMVVFLLTGLWHGAAWHFVIWGAYHGLILILYSLFEKNPAHAAPWDGKHSLAQVFAKWALMFTLTLIGWLLFRAPTWEQIAYTLSNWTPFVSSETWSLLARTFIPAIPLIVVDLSQYASNDILVFTKLPYVIRVATYSLLVVFIMLFAVRESAEFIYFRF